MTRWMVALLALAGGGAQAAGWTQPAGDLYVKVWGRSLIGKGVYTADGDVKELPELFVDEALSVYGELGLVEGLTLLVAGTPIGFARYGDESTTYVGPLSLGLRAGLPVGQTRLALAVTAGEAPDVGEEVLGTGQAEGVDFVYVPTVATRFATAALEVGQPLSFGWLAATGGLRLSGRTGLDPVIIGSAQLGWQTTPTVQLDFHLNLHEPMGEVEVTNVAGAGQTRYLGVGIGVSWWFSPAWALAGGFEGVAYAASNAATPTLSLGLEHRGSLW